METSEENKKMALSEARLADNANQKSGASPAKQSKEPAVDFLADLPYIFAILIAVAKDLSDYVGLGSMPVIGTLVTLMTLCLLSLVIFLAEPGDFYRNFGALFGGTTIDMIPFLNLLPALTAAVVYIYGKKIAERILKNKGVGAKIITGQTSARGGGSINANS